MNSNSAMSRKLAFKFLGLVAVILIAMVAVWKGLPSIVSETPNAGVPDIARVGEGRACETLLRTMSVAEVVRHRPATNRLVVDEHAWFALPENSRRLLVSTARCAALPEGIDYGVVYGARTHERLALANAQGVILD